MSQWLSLAALAGLAVLGSACSEEKTGPLQSFELKDYLRHQWTDEMVSFPIDFKGRLPKSLTLVDAKGQPLPSQLTGVTRKEGRVTGTVTTVVTLGPKETQTLQLQSGTSAATALNLEAKGDEYLLGNEHLTLRLPRFSGTIAQPVELNSLPAPLLAISGPDGKEWLGQGTWVKGAEPLLVKSATTEVIEQGPVRVKVRYRLTFSDDRFYQADFTLGARQEVAAFADETNVDDPKTAFQFSFKQGLGADRIFWRNNFYAKSTKGLAPEPISFEKESLLTKISPWAFWWLEDQTTYVGFYREGATPLVGVIATHPSRWTPIGWDGFARTAIPVTARPGGQLDITLPLLAQTGKKPEEPALTPARRELAFTVGTVADHVTADPQKVKFRYQLIKYSEFPLDEVRRFGFDFKRSDVARKHPFLLFDQGDVDRARRQAKTVPAMKVAVDKAIKYIGSIGVPDPVAKIQKQPDGWKKFFTENYVGNGMYEVVPQAYLGSDDPKYGVMLAAGVKGLAEQQMGLFLEAPHPPTLGGSGHMAGTTMLRLLLAYDAVADSGNLTEEEKADIEAVLVFSGYVFDHPDYWNDIGLMSANPNMTSLLKLPLGLLGLFLDGHPRSANWLKFAEAELQVELKDWIAPGGAFIECPMYQAPTLDGIFLLAKALKTVRGKDYFSDPNFRATMEYYGFILTSPDLRYPPTKTDGIPAPMTIPSIGDAFPVFTHPFNGWMAKETAQSDPAYSARQQSYWKAQSFSCLNGGRAGFIAAVCDPELPSTPPTEMAKKFQGFGNIMRTSWTDPKGSYVSHRNGYFHHHFDPGDANSIIYYAKGVPLCMDFGHRGATSDEVITMWKPFYHNTVAFDRPTPEGFWGMNGGAKETNIKEQEVFSLPSTIDYSTGVSGGSGGQFNNRHLLLVKSADQMGATYLVMRDITKDGQPNQQFTWSMWCMGGEPEITGNMAHFTGQFGVDLDAHVLAPEVPQIAKDKYGYKQWVNPWGHFTEEQSAIHVKKSGSGGDFFALLFPRAAGQGAATVTALAEGRAAKVQHMEGTDVLVLSPGKVVTVAEGDMNLRGEMAFVRRHTDGSVRLAILKGSSATCGGWSLEDAGGSAGLEVRGKDVSGESDGPARNLSVTLPADYGNAGVTVNGKAFPVQRKDNLLTFAIPAGAQKFAITPAK